MTLSYEGSRHRVVRTAHTVHIYVANETYYDIVHAKPTATKINIVDIRQTATYRGYSSSKIPGHIGYCGLSHPKIPGYLGYCGCLFPEVPGYLGYSGSSFSK